MRRYAIVVTEHGAVGFVATLRGLSHVFMMRHDSASAETRVRRTCPDAVHDPDLLPDFQRQISDYLAGRPVRFRVKLDLSSVTPFQRCVLEACSTIEYGETLTYRELARLIGKPKAARAVGGAMARNPVPLVVPCHRVVASNGSLVGFSAEQGVALKRTLLDLESRVEVGSVMC